MELEIAMIPTRGKTASTLTQQLSETVDDQIEELQLRQKEYLCGNVLQSIQDNWELISLSKMSCLQADCTSCDPNGEKMLSTFADSLAGDSAKCWVDNTLN